MYTVGVVLKSNAILHTREVNGLHIVVDAISQSLSPVRLALPKAISISVSNPAQYAPRSDFGEVEGNLPGAGECYYHRKLIPEFFKATWNTVVGIGHLQYLSPPTTSLYLQVEKPNTEFPDFLEDRGVMAYEI